MLSESGRITKGSATLIEYQENENSIPDKFFLQSGVVGMYASAEELKDIYTILHYYLNIDDLTKCKIKIGDEYVDI
jgi:hypothetical protein